MQLGKVAATGPGSPVPHLLRAAVAVADPDLTVVRGVGVEALVFAKAKRRCGGIVRPPQLRPVCRLAADVVHAAAGGPADRWGGGVP